MNTRPTYTDTRIGSRGGARNAVTGDMRNPSNVEGIVSALRAASTTIRTRARRAMMNDRRRPGRDPDPNPYPPPPPPPSSTVINNTDIDFNLITDMRNSYPFYFDPFDPDNEIDLSDVFGYHYDPANGGYSFYNDDEISNGNNNSNNNDDDDRYRLTQDEIDAMLHTTPGLPPNWDCFRDDGDNDNGYNADDWRDDRDLFIP